MKSNLKVRINEFTNNEEVVKKLESILELDQVLFTWKLSCGSERPPSRKIDYFYRCCSLLKYLVENPSGIKKIRKKYSTMKRRGVKPVRKKLASYGPLKLMLNQLESKGLIAHKKDKGYYTSVKGKELL